MPTHRNFDSQISVRLCVALLCAAGCLSLSAADALAQAGAPKAKAPAAGTKTTTPAPAKVTAAPAAKAPVQNPEDAAARERILKSPQFQQTMRDFNQWLTEQSIYDAQQVREMRARLNAGIPKLTAQQLQLFQTDMQEKLTVLTSEAAREANDYFAQTTSVASPAYVRKMRQKLPDVLSMNAAQVNQRLSLFASKKQSTVQAQQAFDASKQQVIAYNQAQLHAEQEESERALDRASRAAAASGGSGHYSSARDYFPNAGNDGPFGPGTSVGFGLGFF